MRKYNVQLSLQVEAVNSFEAVNEFENFMKSKVVNLEKYQVTEITDEVIIKVEPLPIINENEI